MWESERPYTAKMSVYIMKKPRAVIINPDGTATVVLTRGFVAVIDAEDAEIAAAYNWSFRPTHAGRGYAYRAIDSGKQAFSLHGSVFRGEVPDGLVLDHKDGDGLNCRKENLRIATRGQNKTNGPGHRGRKGQYKGVVETAAGRFVASIQVDRQIFRLGRFNTAEEAARAYDAAARKHFREFAWCNFPLTCEDEVLNA